MSKASALAGTSVDIDTILAGYDQPLEETPAPVSMEEKTSDGMPDQKALDNAAFEEHAKTDTALGGQKGNWEGDPRYYQTGSKIGQLRPVKKGVAVSQSPEPVTTTGNEILDGEMLVMLIDTVIPMLLALGNNAISPYKIDPDKMSITAKQQKNLEKLCEKCASKIIMSGDPIWVLVIAVLAIYGMQFYSLRMEAKTEFELAEAKKKKESEAETSSGGKVVDFTITK